MEHPEGIRPQTIAPDHEVLAGLPKEWPAILGYNKTLPLEGGVVLAEVGGNPFIAVREVDKGRTAVVTTDRCV